MQLVCGCFYARNYFCTQSALQSNVRVKSVLILPGDAHIHQLRIYNHRHEAECAYTFNTKPVDVSKGAFTPGKISPDTQMKPHSSFPYNLI